MIRDVLKRSDGTPGGHPEKPGRMLSGAHMENEEGGSCKWVPFASFCTTGQFAKLGTGYVRHCGPTAAVNVIRTLEKYAEQETKKAAAGVASERSGAMYVAEPVTAMWKNWRKQSGNAAVRAEQENLFLICADVGRRMRIYWNTELLGRFGGTFNFLTGFYLSRCFRAVDYRSPRPKIRFHPLITPNAVEKALRSGAIVYLEIYRHPKYKDHHMLCYGCRHTNGKREFLLADGWAPRPVWAEDSELGRGHFLTIRCG